ncbi:retron Ec78 anti-phage system effector ATPase PtuA [Providencia vermicola]|uniref:AAA family ATPase n=1 Tax=Providencia vermicola TaxID=333965 RepID=A0AAX3S064_9GAMM|nr:MULTISPECIES: retron Ec78 anti-phage system effector ATPase PtuA [Providencia]ELX8379847.1 AAA family ATPase [Providencia stuartii]EMD5259237.1 AAA family ATPase [Providencia stuartii]USB38284.1 AAA family ATPase [Providencia vermicola]WFC07219.1 AAA family ATPase [Providencia vermicola]
MTKQLERKARGGSLLAAFELFQITKNSPEESNEWLDLCWYYLQSGDKNKNGVFQPTNPFYLRSFSCTDFRRFSSLELQLEKDLTVIIGNNGQGKSSILTAIAKILSWFSANILREDGAGQRFNEWTDIKNDAELEYTDVFSHFYFGRGLKFIPIRLSRSAVGSATRRDSLVKDVKNIADIWRVINAQKVVNLPIFAFYSVERSHPYIRPREISEIREERFDAYTNALSGAGRFDHFIEWFIALHKRTTHDTTSVNELKQLVNDLTISVNNGLVSVKPLLEDAQKKLNAALEKNAIADNLSEQYQKQLIIKAISQIVPSISDIWVEITSGIDKIKVVNDGQKVTVEQLSDGQRVLLGLVADLARRMIMLNPLLDNPFEGQGIVLIDELELHLHPKWQQDAIPNLTRIFPNLQFIVTTHSPIVLSTVDKRCVRIFNESNNGKEITLNTPDFQTKGVINSDILELVMEVSATPLKIAESHWVDDFDQALTHADYSHNSDAQALYQKIKHHFGENSIELKRCDNLIKIAAMKLKVQARKNEKDI